MGVVFVLISPGPGPTTTLEGTRIVSASGKIEVLAGQNLDIRPAENTSFVEDTFKSWSLVGNSLDYALNHKVKDRTTEASTTLTGAYISGNNVQLVAGGNAHLVATTLLGKTGATVMAGGTVLIEAGKETFSRSHEHQESGHGVRVIKTDGRVHVVAPNENFEKLKDNGSTVTPVFSVIDSAKGAVTISGGLDVALLGTRINAATDVNLTADQRLLLGGALATTSHDDEQEKGTVIGRMRDGESLDTQTGTVVPGSINAGGKVNLTADAGVELGAVAIRSGGATVFGAPSVSFVAERSSDYLSHKVWDKDRGYEVNQGDGHVDERLSLATIDAKGGLTLPETTKISVQLDGHVLDPAGNAAASTAGNSQLTAVTPEQFKSLANQLSLQPGMAYLADLAKRTDIDWQAVSTAHQKWDYKTQGLTQTGAAVLAIVVAIFTYGAGAEWLTAAGSTTTSTAVGATAGTTVVTTTGVGTISTATTTVAAGGAAATTTVVVSTAAGAVASAAVTSLATSAAIAFANNGGDLGKTLDDLGSSETIKGMLTSMITAGITNAEIFQSGNKMISLNQMANVQTVPGLGSVGTFNWDNLGQTALGVAGRSIVSAGVSTAINGGSFEDSFRQSLVSDLAAIGANAIGTTWGSGANKDPFMQTAAHGLLGCASAAATGKDCAAGALGGAAESVLGNIVDKFGGLPSDGNGPSRGARAIYTGGAIVLADILADATKLDAGTAIDAARNSATNNFLAHADKDRLAQLRARGDKRTASESTELVYLETADQLSDGLLNKYRSGAPLTDSEQRNLAIYLGNFRRQDGADATIRLVQNGPTPTYTYPYAGGSEDRGAYMDKVRANSGWGPVLSWFAPRDAMSSNEQTFNSARIQAGLFLNTAPNESFLPTSLAMQGFFSEIDALRNSALASGGYLGATALGASADTRRGLTLVLSNLSDIGSAFILPRAGISPVFGQTTGSVVDGVSTTAINGASRTVPLGFESEAQFLSASRELQTALRNSGIDDAVVGARGSSVTGVTANPKSPNFEKPFRPDSDVDFFAQSQQLVEGFKKTPDFVHPDKVIGMYPELRTWSEKWTEILGRDITPAAWKPGALPPTPAILVKPQ